MTKEQKESKIQSYTINPLVDKEKYWHIFYKTQACNKIKALDFNW